MMNSGTSCTPITISAKPHYPPLVVAALLRKPHCPHHDGLVMSNAMEEELALSARVLTEPNSMPWIRRAVIVNGLSRREAVWRSTEYDFKDGFIFGSAWLPAA